MSRLFVSLISLLALSAQAAELEWNLNGYATATHFQSQEFQPDTSLIAVNGSLQYENFAIRTQVADRETAIRRFAVEYSLPIVGNNLLVQLGRLPRLTTLFSDVYGNPDEWGMAVLPLSTYNRRKVHSLAFQAYDGVKVMWDHPTSIGHVRATANYGRNIEEFDCEWQMEAVRKPCMSGWTLRPQGNNYDAALEFSRGPVKLLASVNHVSAKSELLNSKDRTGIYFTKMVPTLDYYFYRQGVKYEGSRWYVQAEHGENRLWFGDKLYSTARDDYVMGGYDVTGNCTAFGGYSSGHERGSTFTSRDRFGGGICRVGQWAFSLEHHNGEGSWQRIDSRVYDWGTWVASATVTF